MEIKIDCFCRDNRPRVVTSAKCIYQRVICIRFCRWIMAVSPSRIFCIIMTNRLWDYMPHSCRSLQDVSRACRAYTVDGQPSRNRASLPSHIPSWTVCCGFYVASQRLYHVAPVAAADQQSVMSVSRPAKCYCCPTSVHVYMLLPLCLVIDNRWLDTDAGIQSISSPWSASRS